MVDSSGTDSEAENSRWTWEENKQFEDGLVEFPGDCSNRWERIAARLGTKTAAEIEQHFAVLLDDVAAIQAGLIELPEYADKDGFRSSEPQKNPKSEKKQVGMQRKAARPWTEDEHSKHFYTNSNSKYQRSQKSRSSQVIKLTRRRRRRRRSTGS